MKTHTPELMRSLLRYDPETGKLFWKPRSREMFKTGQQHKTWNTRYAGMEAFTAGDGKGYKQGAILSKIFLAHRVVWMIAKGDIPEGMQIDHINRVKDDNRVSNLRLATKAQNAANTGIRAGNTSGVKGVTWNKNANRWQAQISVNGETKYLGYFEDIRDAGKAYAETAADLRGAFAHHSMQCETLPVTKEMEP